MFKNYLTYSFALRFQRSCHSAPLANPLKARIQASAELVTQHLDQSIRSNDPKSELKHLCVALMALRDCKETLDQGGSLGFPIETEYLILHQRLEHLCLKASETEGGQLRMLG